MPEQKRRVQEDIASILKRKKSINNANTTSISKIKHDDKGEDDDDYIDENKPDSEFLKKVKKYSNRKLNFGNSLRKIKNEEIKKSLINEIDSADKNKDQKSNKNIHRIRKKKEKQSEESGTHVEEKNENEDEIKKVNYENLGMLNRP